MFGKGFWDHVTLGVSKWAYDELSVENRNRTGKTESWWIGEKNKQLQARFHVKRDLDAVFIDSWSQQPWNVDDELQQIAFHRETQKLWDSFSSKESFEFKTVEDVAEELHECKLLLEDCYENC